MTALPFRLPPALGLFAALWLGSGCVFVAQPNPNAPGDITFLWSFAGEGRCASAGVDEVGVQVVTLDGVAAYEDVLDCQGGGLTLEDFAPGNYEVWLDAFSASGTLLYAGEAPVTVQPGGLNDLGTVRLERVVGTGDLSLFWGFRYPTDESADFDCARAGVQEVDVTVEPLDRQGEGFAGTLLCEDEGLFVEGLVEGEYRVTLAAFGRYQNQDLALYERSLRVDVSPGGETALGDVLLDRIDENFSDIEVTWDLPGLGCGELGIDEVEFVIRRVSPSFEDDAFTVPCERAVARRQTFVPGAYLIEASAIGSAGTYFGAVTRNVAPDTLATANVDLILSD